MKATNSILLDCNVENIHFDDVCNNIEQTLIKIMPKVTDYIFNNYLLPQNLLQKELILSLLLTNDSTIAEINLNWLGIKKPTNVLSMAMFDWEKEDLSIYKTIALGDLVISIETSKKEALQENVDFIMYIIKLFVHGLFHILEFIHDNDKEALKMQEAEDNLLKYIGVNCLGLTSNYWE